MINAVIMPNECISLRETNLQMLSPCTECTDTIYRTDMKKNDFEAQKGKLPQFPGLTMFHLDVKS